MFVNVPEEFFSLDEQDQAEVLEAWGLMAAGEEAYRMGLPVFNHMHPHFLFGYRQAYERGEGETARSLGEA